MKYKEFVEWCNQRACDGCWGMQTAIICSEIMKDVRKQPFWKREKYWRENCEKEVLEEIVNPLNQKRKEMFQR